MQCPRCGSDNVTNSHLRGVEKVFQYIVPSVPYRCKECWTRFWKFEKTKALKIAISGMLAVLLICVIVFFALKGRKTSPPDSASSSPPVAEQPAVEMDKTIQEYITQTDTDTGTSDNLKPSSDSAPASNDTDETARQPSFEIPEELPPPSVTASDAGKDDSRKADVKATDTVKDSEVSESAEKAASSEKKSEPVVSKPSYQIFKGVRTDIADDSFQMTILADTPIGNYKSFSLENPLRLVINIPGKWKNSGKNEISVKSDIIRRIRVGEHRDKTPPFLSIVLDAHSGASLMPKFAKSPEGLILTLEK